MSFAASLIPRILVSALPLAAACTDPAADRTFARFMPAEVGLREVAEAAGVTHGLVTHYFGTYDELVAATLARRLDAARDQVLARLVSASFGPDELPLIDALIELVHEPLTMRLLTWSLVSGRASATSASGAGADRRAVTIGVVANHASRRSTYRRTIALSSAWTAARS